MRQYISKESCTFIKPTLTGDVDYIKFPALAQVKYDGEICWAKIKDNKCKLYSEQHIGRVRVDCPITKELESLQVDNTIFVGELYYGDGKNWSQFMTHKLSDSLQYAIYDVLKYNGKSVRSLSLNDRMQSLKGVRHLKNVHVADSLICYNSADVEAYFEDTICRNYEGIVVKTIGSHLKTNTLRSHTVIVNDCYAILPIMGFSKKKHKMSILVGTKNFQKDRIEPLAQCKINYGPHDIEQIRNFLSTFAGRESEAYVLMDKDTYIMAQIKHSGVLYNLRGNKPHSLRSPEFIKILPNKKLVDTRL